MTRINTDKGEERFAAEARRKTQMKKEERWVDADTERISCGNTRIRKGPEKRKLATDDTGEHG
jgi:hypothetical protein